MLVLFVSCLGKDRGFLPATTYFSLWTVEIANKMSVLTSRSKDIYLEDWPLLNIFSNIQNKWRNMFMFETDICSCKYKETPRSLSALSGTTKDVSNDIMCCLKNE